MNNNVNISVVAYLKTLFHCIKFPSQPVNGIITGKISENQSNGFDIFVLDCYPMFHQKINLLPLLETGLLQIDNILQLKNKKQQQKKEQNNNNNDNDNNKDDDKEGDEVIIGYYFCNENIWDVTMNNFHKSICSKIQNNLQNFYSNLFKKNQNQNQSVVCWNVDNNRLVLDEEDIEFAINVMSKNIKNNDFSIHTKNKNMIERFEKFQKTNLFYMKQKDDEEEENDDDNEEEEEEEDINDVYENFEKLTKDKKITSEDFYSNFFYFDSKGKKIKISDENCFSKLIKLVDEGVSSDIIDFGTHLETLHDFRNISISKKN